MGTETDMHTIPTIDYRKIADAKEFYEKEGFLHLDVPWIVSFESYSGTRPPDRKEFYTLGGYLNASAEQSFMEMMNGGAKLSRHLAITPCFRDEDALDEIHYRYFLKLELIDTDVTRENLDNTIAAAKRFMERYMPVEVVKTGEDAYDLCDRRNGIELGSYGIRHWKDFTWIYGTGIALPRFDVVLAKYR